MTTETERQALLVETVGAAWRSARNEYRALWNRHTALYDVVRSIDCSFIETAVAFDTASRRAIKLTEQARIEAAIAAVRAADREAQWQPIETAPKDGTEVLVFRRNCLVQPIGVDKFNKYGQWTYSDNNRPPTAWQPCPEPPAGDTP